MKKILSILILLMFSMGMIYAQENTVKMVYDLTTKELKNFELRVLKATVANKAYYEGLLRELEISIVIHGGAYKFFLKDPTKSKFKDDTALLSSYKTLAKRIAILADTYEVEFLVCGSGLKKHALEKKDLYGFVKVIPNATIGLTDKQNEGYAYIPVRD